jgi:hypothetical protein
MQGGEVQIQSIVIERRGGSTPCGTLWYRKDGRRAAVLWLMQLRRGQKISVEFVPAEGAAREDLRAHHDDLVESVSRAVFEQTSRKSLFT